VTVFKYCVYIFAQPGAAGAEGKPIYMVHGTIPKAQFYAFLSYLGRKMDKLLSPFFRYNNVDDVIRILPPGLGDNEQEIIRSRWPFFHKLRQSALDCKMTEFPGCPLFKTSFQSLYNVVKGGVDANTLICLILAIVSNSWRAVQQLQMDSNIEELQFSQVQKKLQNSKVKLTKFCYDLAVALICIANDRSALNEL
jgi:hypothetical protein